MPIRSSAGSFQASRAQGRTSLALRLNNELIAKRLEILHELVPSATLVALLVNPAGPLTDLEMTLTQADLPYFLQCSAASGNASNSSHTLLMITEFSFPTMR